MYENALKTNNWLWFKIKKKIGNRSKDANLKNEFFAKFITRYAASVVVEYISIAWHPSLVENKFEIIFRDFYKQTPATQYWDVGRLDVVK